MFSKTFKLNWCRHKSNALPALRGSEDGTKGVGGKVQPPGLQAVQTSWCQHPALVGESSSAHVCFTQPQLQDGHRVCHYCFLNSVRTLPEAEEQGEEGPGSLLCSCLGNLDGKIPVNKAGEGHMHRLLPLQARAQAGLSILHWLLPDDFVLVECIQPT